MPELPHKNGDCLIRRQSSLVFDENQVYELVIIGSGISCAYTLIHYLQLLSKKPLVSKRSESKSQIIRLAVIEKSGEFWTGIAYGKKSTRQSLIITPLKEFLPQTERSRFVEWLQNNHLTVMISLKQREGSLSDKWIKSYREAINLGNWNDLFIPRYLFGLYLQERMLGLLEQAKNYLRCDLIKANVCNIHKKINIYQIDTVEGKCIIANKIVLAIGSPPNKIAFQQKIESSRLSYDACYITNMYEPSQTSNIIKISDRLQTNRHRARCPNQILIIGSNASALETIYNLNNLPEVANLIDRFIVISPSATFPHQIADCPVSPTYKAKNLELLLKQSDVTAKQIYEAAKQDVLIALDSNETIDSTYPIISQAVIKALNQLCYVQQKQFVTKYGVEIGKFQRRAGIDYLSVADSLASNGKLEFIRGKFIDRIPLSEGFGFKFVTPNNEQPQLYPNSIQIIINCAGFQDLTKSSSPLINSLIQQGICIPNDSKCGFKINENFEAHQNLYLMGPLIAGNINDRFKVWHAESCGRIFNLSLHLAEILVKDANNLKGEKITDDEPKKAEG